jgi:hypothetical protein
MEYRHNTVPFGTVRDISEKLVVSIFKAEVAENITQGLK